MKTLKINILAILGLLLVTGCTKDIEDYDTVAEIHDEAGATVQVSATSNSAILGNPEPGIPLEDATVTITDAYLDLTVRLTAGNLDQIEKIEIVKSFNNGTEIPLGETTTLPYNLVIDNIDDLLADTGIAETDLRIGDELTFRTKVTQTDGDVYYYNTSMGNYNMVVNCSSDLAGTYTINYSSGVQPHYVTELSPGVYQINSMMGWPTSSYWVNFTDVCGVLSIDNDWVFSGGNPASGEGYVDSDGNLVWTSVTVEGAGYDNLSWTMYRQ